MSHIDKIVYTIRNPSLSESFASGALLSFIKRRYELIEQILCKNSVPALNEFIAEMYKVFCRSPEIGGYYRWNLDMDNNDTDPSQWSVEIVHLQTGEAAILLCMPVQDKLYAARMIGIIPREKNINYYYSMIWKEYKLPSDVKWNRDELGVEKVGEVKGSGPKLRESFLECISEAHATSSAPQVR